MIFLLLFIIFRYFLKYQKIKCILTLEMVKGVVVMIIGTILLAIALPVGIVLAVDLLNEQQQVAPQSNHS